MSEESKPSPKGKRKLAESPNAEHHVQQLAKKIMEDPSFPMLHETARKLHEKEARGE